MADDLFALVSSVDHSVLQRGMTAALQYTKRSLPEMCNTSALEIAINTKHNTPFVTAATMDAELGARVTALRGKSGRPLSAKYAKNRLLTSHKMGRERTTVPMGVLIIQARQNPGSFYNASTGHRYALPPGQFKGLSRALANFKMMWLINNMLKARHGSGNFLMAGWNPAIAALKPFTRNKWRGNYMPDGADNFYGSQLGEGSPAVAGSMDVICIIENNIGGEGRNEVSMRQALIRKGLPPAQAAVDSEGMRNLQYAAQKFQAEMTQTFNRP